MDLDLLQTFVIFAKSKNITEAAQKLRISQPTVSLQLQRLEQGLKHPVFSVEGKKKVLTPFGKALLEEIAPVLGGLEAALERVERRYADPKQLTLRIGARGEILPRIVQKVRFPGAIQFVPLGTQQAVDKLMAHEIDIAISYLKPDSTQIRARKIFSDRVHWVCHEKLLKKLSPEKASSSVEFMTETPFLAYKPRAPFLKEWLAHLVPKGHESVLKKIRVHRICEDWNAILKLVEQGEGFSLIPSSIEVKSPAVQVALLPEEALPAMTFYALYHDDLMKIAAIEKSLSFSDSGK